jgi:hypothetical protein
LIFEASNNPVEKKEDGKDEKKPAFDNPFGTKAPESGGLLG